MTKKLILILPLLLLVLGTIAQDRRQEDSIYHRYQDEIIRAYWIYPSICLRAPTAAEKHYIDSVNSRQREAHKYLRKHADPCRQPYYNHDTLNFDIK